MSQSQEGFSDIVGLHRTYIGAIERGERNISIRNLIRIAQALGTRPSELMAQAERLISSQGGANIGGAVDKSHR